MRRTVELFYEDLGDPADPPVLLIMGLGAQLPMWPDGFCAQFVDAGYRVIRFDHRDTGLSPRCTGSVPRARFTGASAATWWAAQSGAVHPDRHDQVVVGLLDHLGITRAHVVGASFGGMIAQILAATEPNRVAWLGDHSMSNRQAVVGATGGGSSSWPSTRRQRRPSEEKLAFEVATSRCSTAPTSCHPTTSCAAASSNCRTAVTIRRACCASSTPSSAPAACCATPAASPRRRWSSTAPRTRWCGRATAATWPAAIPGARFVVVDGMGHDLPEPVWRPIVEALTENFALAPARAKASERQSRTQRPNAIFRG